MAVYDGLVVELSRVVDGELVVMAVGWMCTDGRIIYRKGITISLAVQ